MRQTRKSQLALGEARIEDIKLDHKSRDDIPAVLLGLQHLYSHEQTREKLFSVLEEHIVPGTNRNVGRPGMELWRILVMGVLKQGLPASCITFLSEQAFAPQNTRFWSRRRVWFQFTVGEDKPPMLSVDNRGKGVLSMDCSAKRSPL